jgi:Trypsin-like peptidase domain
MTLSGTDVERVARILASQAANADQPGAYLRDLIKSSVLPDKFRNQVLGKTFANLDVDSRDLVRWADSKGINPADPRLTALGSIIYVLLDDVGLDLAADLVAVMVVNRLIRQSALLGELISKYQVPVAATHMDDAFPLPKAVGLAADDDEAELQRLTPGPPDLLDVGFLTFAIRRAASVCRIERPDETAIGTGFLVGPDLVLTNKHVVDAAGTVDLRLRFRYTSMAGGTQLRLSLDEPVARSSPVDELDFAALRLARPVGADDGIEVIEPGEMQSPLRGDALSILQHPGGGPIKLAISANGVVGTFPQRSTVRYVTAAAGGSSGSPCFDESWNLVAIHRAERATIFGSVREGILIKDVWHDILSLL